MASPKRPQKKSGFKVILKKAFFSQIASFLTIIFGAVLIFTAAAKFFNLDIFHPYLVKSQPTITSVKPVRLYIPKLSKNLTIEEGEVVNNRWTISQTGVSYLSNSALPGTAGNSVVYGHNRNNILGRLPYISNGDKIYILLSNGEFVKYEVLEEKEISPYQVEILSQTSDSRLTIFTCSGFLDSARFAVIARQI